MIIFASDLDGTLVNNNEIKKEDLLAIDDMINDGGKFVICTGRSFNGIDVLIKNYHLNYSYLVLCNGGIIVDNKGNYILDEWINKGIAKNIINHYNNKEDILVYADNVENTYLFKNDNISSDKTQKIIDKFSQDLKLSSVSYINSDYKTIGLFSIEANIDKMKKIQIEIEEEFKDYIEVYRNNEYIDIVPKRCSKGNALKLLLKIEKLNNNNLYVIGDSFNDIPMFEVTNNTFTLFHADEEIKKITKYLVADVKSAIKLCQPFLKMSQNK